MQNFADFEIAEAEKDGVPVAVFLIDPPDYPLVFEKPGQYALENNSRQVTVFGQGTIFFRHGAKTESGTTDDLRRFMQARFRETRDEIIKGLRRVSEAPRGSELHVTSVAPVAPRGVEAIPVRLTTDAAARDAIAVDRHTVCPFRQKEVMQKLRERLPDGPLPTTHDIQAVVKLYGVADNEAFAWKPEFSSRQYSEAFIDWLLEQLRTTPDFLADVRRRFYELSHPSPLKFD